MDVCVGWLFTMAPLLIYTDMLWFSCSGFLHLVLSNLYTMWYESYCMIVDPMNHLFWLSDTRFFRLEPDGTKSLVFVFGMGLLDLLDDVFWMLSSSFSSARQAKGVWIENSITKNVWNTRHAAVAAAFWRWCSAARPATTGPASPGDLTRAWRVYYVTEISNFCISEARCPGLV